MPSASPEIRRLIAAALLLATASCGQLDAPSQDAPGAHTPESTPAAVAASKTIATDSTPYCAHDCSGFLWGARIDGEHAILGYVVPETDAEPVLMECQRGEGEIKVTAYDPLLTGAQLMITAGGATEIYPATPAYDPTYDEGVYAVAEVPSSSAVLRAFGSTGVLAVQVVDAQMPAKNEEERQAIARFLAFCEPAVQAPVHGGG